MSMERDNHPSRGLKDGCAGPESVRVAERSALIVDQQRGDRVAVAARTAGAARIVGGRRRGRQRALQRLQELLQQVGDRAVAGRTIAAARRRGRGRGRGRAARGRRARRRAASAAGTSRAPLPPGPLAKALANTFCNSLAWSLVSLPDDTSLWMRSSIFDFMSPGEDCVPLDRLLERSDCSEESISVSAEESADWSDELMVPEETSDCSSFCSICSGGDW